ncbi:MAG: dephospho-CoA kinase [Paludibacteraceae bacterium]|nr:dephospho-CoA kinase [Paludibacteraceae bacterium]
MIIGLTGGIGSGKSTIAMGLVRYGLMHYDCDTEAKRLIESDPAIKQQIISLLGQDVYQDGHYQTNIAAEKVFAQPKLLQQLNAIVHPAVKQDILNSPIHRLTGSPIIIESAILWESGLNEICDRTVAVIAPEEIRLQRAIQRDNSNIQKVHARMRAQMSDAEREQRADITINNDGQKSIDELCQYIMQHL